MFSGDTLNFRRSFGPTSALAQRHSTNVCLLLALSFWLCFRFAGSSLFHTSTPLEAQGYSLNCLFLLFIHCNACITATVRAVTLSKLRPECHSACTETGETKCEWPLHIDGRFMPLLFSLPPFYLTCARPKSWTKEASWWCSHGHHDHNFG